MIGCTIFRRRRRASDNTKLRTITATFLAGIFALSIFSQLTAFAAGNLFKIKTAEITEISATSEGNITSYDDENIVSNIEFHQLNDEAKFKVILENTSAKDHVIETIEDDNTNPYIIYVYDNHAGETVAAGSELVFEFVAKYETQAAMDARAIASNVKFFIKYSEVEEPDEVELLVPNTGWGTVMGTESKRTVIRISTLATIISGATLIVICVATVIRRKQSRNRRTVRSARRVAVAALALAAITVSTTVRAINVETSSFTLTTNYALKDRLQVTWTDAEDNEHEEIVNYNEQVNIPEQTKEGHTLTGWEDENGNPVDPTQPFTDDTKIHPVFRAHKYTIKFNGNGATDGAMENLEMTFGEAKTLPANAFVWSGRTYTGWDTEANGSGAHYGDQDNVVDLTTEDNVIVNLHAQWSINPFHIDYDGNEATSGEMATTNCEYDQECILRENAFARTGYDYKGWVYNGADYADKADVTNIIDNGTITMVAKWELHEYTITYLGLTDEEKSALRTQGNPDTYTILTPSFTLHNPENRYDADGDKTQHFEGWRESTVSTTITLPQTDSLSNKIYEAIWSDVATPEYTVTYDYDGGDVATANKTKFTKFESFTLNEPVKEGYTFTGWTGTDVTTETKPYTVPTGVRHNLEFTAHYRKNTYSVAFDINTDDANISGSMSPMTGLEYDTNYNLTTNSFARTGYTFGGWNTQADGQGNDYADQGEFNNLTAEDGGTATLYAKWNPTQYTIVFHANNENVENPDAMAAQVVTYDVETTLSPIEYTWWQHKLVEWTTNANGTGTKYADKATIKNLNANGGEVHLYAKWREIDAALQAGGVGRSPTGTRINALLAANPDAKRFVKYTDGVPSDEVLANAVDTSGTIDPIWLWVEGENLYWWSEDVKPRISSRLTSTDCLFNGAGTYTVDGVTKHLEYADLTGFDTSNITDYGRTFHSSGILEINISDWDFSHATNMSEFIAFGAVKKATFPEVVDARNVTNMSLALNFGMVTDELDLSGWKTRDVKNLSNFLLGMQAKKIKFSSDFKTNNVETMASMFYGNSKLTSIEGLEYFDTAKVKNMSNMFASVSSMESLDLSTFSTAALTNMNGMFRGMSSLASLTLGGSFKANDVTDFTNTFKGLTKLQTIDLSNLTSTPTDMSSMFESSSGAKVIDISGMDLSAVTKFTYTFIACSNLETIYVSNNPNQENIADDGHIFLYSGPKIVGGAGSNHLGSAAGTGNGGGEGQSVYARIDDPDNGKPGYFTPKDSIYIRYHDNDGDDTNDETNYALMPSYYVSTTGANALRTNAFVRDHYKFMGWAKTADGEVVYADGATISEEASKTPLELYAQWEPTIATVTFNANHNDATGSMQPQTVTGGVQTTLMANGFDVPHWRFLGWTTEAQPNVISNENADVDFVNQADVTNLAEDTELYGKWLFRCRTFETDSWATIVANLANDPNYYDATDGCQKEVEMDIVGSDGKWGSDGVNESYTVMLTNTSTPEECATEGFSQTACGTVIEFVDKVTERRWTNKAGTNAVAGGWKASELAGWLNGDFYEKLPDDLKQVIIPSYIVSSNAGGLESPDITLGDTNLNKIYLYSTKELGQPRTSSSNIEDNKIDSTRVADFYNIADNRSNYINRGSQLNNQWHSWWLRSSVLQRNNLPHDVQTVVTAGPGAENALGIFPVFRIGIPRYSYTNCVDGSTFETEIYLGNDYPCYDSDFIVTKDDAVARNAYPNNITIYDVPGGIIVEPYNDSISTGPLVPWVQGTIRVKAAENTRVLNYQALAGFRSAKTIMLPNALTTIGNESLRLIPQMEFLALPDSVQSIGDNALKDCSSLTAILYRGTIYTTTSALTSALAENGVALGSNIFSGVPMPTE